MEKEKLSINDLLDSPNDIEPEFSGYPNYDIKDEDPSRFYLAEELGISPFDLMLTEYGADNSHIYETQSGEVYQVLCTDEADEAAIKSEEELLKSEGVETMVSSWFYEDYVIGDKMFKQSWFNDWLDEYNDSLIDDGEEPIEVNDPVQLFLDTFDEKELESVLSQNDLYDYHAIAEEIVRQDGPGPILASYDGKELRLTPELSAFRIE